MSAEPRVLQVTALPITAELFVLPLARALDEAGFDVELVTGPGPRAPALEAAGFTVHRLPISRSPLSWRNLHAIGSLRGRLRTGQYGLVHTHTPSASALVRLAVGSRARVFYTMHGSLWGPNAPAGKRTVFTLLERALRRRTDRVFTVNDEDAADCVRIAGYERRKVARLPTGGAGVPDEFFQAATRPELREQARSELGLGPDEPVVGYVGRTVAAKGLGVLARAFGRILARVPAARLCVVGDALPGDRDAYSRARFLAESGNVAADRVLWPGFREAVTPLLAAFDLIVLPSFREGFGMSLAEAAAVGRPAVATATRGARAVIEPGLTGRIVPIGDAGALASAVADLLERAELRARMGREARQRAAERFRRSLVLAAYLAAYRELWPADTSGTGAG